MKFKWIVELKWIVEISTKYQLIHNLVVAVGKKFYSFLWLNNQSCIWAGFYFALNFGVCNFSLLIGHLFLAYQCFFSMHVMKDVVEQTLH